MAFWMDPLLLFLSGMAIVLVKKKLFFNSTRFIPIVSAAVMVLFWVVSISMFCNLEIARSAWEVCGAESGTEWMLNGGILNVVEAGATFSTLSPELMFVCIFMFVVYPIYLWLGLLVGNKIFKTPLGT